MRYVVCAVLALICATLGAQTLAAGPQFEVATVKPVASDVRSSMMREMSRETMRSVLNMQPPGMIPMTGPNRVRLHDWALLDLIAAAYSVRATRVSGPAWLTDQRFDIEAKMPDNATKEELNAMLQSLLEERFGLKVHRGPQTGPGFALVVGKDGPKLKTAEAPPTPAPGLTDEEQRALFQQKRQANIAAMRKRAQENPGLSTSGWDGITMEELAAELVQFTEAPVIDETGLTGKYSVTIETSKDSDAPGGTVFDAVEKLGLKLEPRKVTVETVVVDQISRTPTAN
jgi:uncharacterized protein (TIGR03435 family)